MQERINALLLRLQKVEELMGNPESFSDQKLYKELTREHAYLVQVKEAHDALQKASTELVQNKELLLSEKDPEMIAIIKEEIADLELSQATYQKKLETLLVPPDPNDDKPVILEIRAGTGGDEAALFVGNLARMYKQYAESKGWKVENINSDPSEIGGFKEYILGISGASCHRFLQYEAGTHRVQRVPETETQGRLHTSAATVAVLLEPEETEIEIDPKDLEIDTYRASGAGGQHVNTTDSAVRITHKPTGTVVCCQDERSQHKNREKALRLLGAKVSDTMRRAQVEERSNLRSSQVGSGDRSERIRTYNYPQNRVTDHRIDLTLYKLEMIMAGDLDEITQRLVAYFYEKQLQGE